MKNFYRTRKKDKNKNKIQICICNTWIEKMGIMFYILVPPTIIIPAPPLARSA